MAEGIFDSGLVLPGQHPHISYSTDGGRRILSMNPLGCLVLGWREDELVGADVIEKLRPDFMPALRQAYLDELIQAHPDETRHYDNVWLRAYDGRRVDLRNATIRWDSQRWCVCIDGDLTPEEWDRFLHRPQFPDTSAGHAARLALTQCLLDGANHEIEHLKDQTNTSEHISNVSGIVRMTDVNWQPRLGLDGELIDLPSEPSSEPEVNRTHAQLLHAIDQRLERIEKVVEKVVVKPTPIRAVEKKPRPDKEYGDLRIFAEDVNAAYAKFRGQPLRLQVPRFALQHFLQQELQLQGWKLRRRLKELEQKKALRLSDLPWSI